MRNKLHALKLILLGCLISANAFAAEKVKDVIAVAPITIEADEAVLQEKQGESVYRGNVSLKQAGLSFNAEEVRVQSTDGHLNLMIATGNPVKFTQQTPQDKPIRAEARRIEYFASLDKVVFSGQATLFQGSNAFSGDVIEYNIKTDTVKAGSTDNSQKRVKVTIQPDQADGTGGAQSKDSGNQQDSASNNATAD